MTTVLFPNPYYSEKSVKDILEKSKISLNEKPITAERAIELIGMDRLQTKMIFIYSQDGPFCEFSTKEGKIFIRKQQNE